jgi:hypothetical protein
MTVPINHCRTNCAHPIRVVRCAQLLRPASANRAHPGGQVRAVRAAGRGQPGEPTKRAHPPIPPRGCAAGWRRRPANSKRARLKFALAVRGSGRATTFAHVAAPPVVGPVVPLVARARRGPTWAGTARGGRLWVAGATAAANRYFPALAGRRCRREQPQTPTDLLPAGRRAYRPASCPAPDPRRSPTSATGRAVAPLPRPYRPSPHGPTWAAVAADRPRPVRLAPAWRHVP